MTILVCSTSISRGRESGGDAWKQYVRWSACTSAYIPTDISWHLLNHFACSQFLRRSAPSARRKLLCLKDHRVDCAAVRRGSCNNLRRIFNVDLSLDNCYWAVSCRCEYVTRSRQGSVVGHDLAFPFRSLIRKQVLHVVYFSLWQW